MCIVLIIVQFYLAVWPLGVTPNAKDFFATYVSVPLVILMYLIGKVIYRTPKWVDLSTIDLDYGRRFYADEPEKKEKNAVVRGLKAVFS